MSAPLRFLGVAILAYVGLRTASSALALEPVPGMTPPPAPAGPEMAALPPGVPADMGPPSAYPAGYYGPAVPSPTMAAMPPMPPMPPMPMVMPYPVMPAMMPMPQRARMSQPVAWAEPPPEQWPEPPQRWRSPHPPEDEQDGTAFAYEAGAAPPLDRWPAIGTAGPFSVGGLQRTPSWGSSEGGGPLRAAGNGLWSMDLWALARQPRSGLLSTKDPDAGLNPGLASAGSLGGSQAGMRLSWRPLPRAGVHLRLSSALLPQGRGGQAFAGGEGSLGVSYQPIATFPVRLLAERRQRLGPALGGGRNAFAFLAEGGLYEREVGRGIRLDGYGQAGLVGARRRSLFADGALTATTPILPRFTLGGGMWGGVQPGLSRFDAGPRLGYQLSPRMRMNLDYRFRLTGRADPPSGPALTVSGGF